MTEPGSGAPAERFGVLLTVAYDGRPFSGFARQPHARTVAGELDGAVRAMDPRASLVRGASRTDRGVHAHGQVVAFDTDKDIEPRGWVLGITRHLPEQIAVVRAARVEVGFEPRFEAAFKTYRYLLLHSDVRDPFLEGRAWRITHRLNHELLIRESEDLVGEHDFRAFRASVDERKTTVRRLVRVQVRNARGDERCTEIVVRGNGFLYRMMRIITGTLVDVASGRLPPGAFQRALKSGARGDLGMTAPADGLYLEQVELRKSGSDPWPISTTTFD